MLIINAFQWRLTQYFKFFYVHQICGWGRGCIKNCPPDLPPLNQRCQKHEILHGVYPCIKSMQCNLYFYNLGKGNLLFYCTGSRQNHFRQVGGHNNKNPKFHIDHRGKETSATFGLPIQKNSAVSVLLPSLFYFSPQ